MDLRLNRTHEALAALLPQHTMRVVQVLGTNGKGSSSTFLAALGRAHGLRTGLYTSPHFVSPRERIRINGHMLSEELWLRWANTIHPLAPTLTYFEFITVLAICAFQEAGVELAIMEAGLGGRHDATSALPVDMLCYTPIAMDHESVLGDSLAAIAADKADAMRQGAPVVTGPQEPEALNILQSKATSTGCPLLYVGTSADDATAHAASGMTCVFPELPARHWRMHGLHQQTNARLALAAWQHLASLHGWNTQPNSHERTQNALEQAFIPGRLQYIPAQHGLPALLLDGGHNPHGLTALAKALRQHSAPPQAIIFSCLADKNIAGMIQPLRELAGAAPIIVPTITDNPRACPSTELVTHIGPQAMAVGTLQEALARARAIVSDLQPQQSYVVLCGSLYLLSELYTLYPAFLEHSPTPQEPA